MTYDVQRWDSPDYDVELEPLDDGLWVLAADAEAHEKAAVRQARQQAVRDCADDLDARVVRERDEGDGDGLLAGMEYAVECVRALLEGDER